jgi:hypothetical protein
MPSPTVNIRRHMDDFNLDLKFPPRAALTQPLYYSVIEQVLAGGREVWPISTSRIPPATRSGPRRWLGSRGGSLRPSRAFIAPSLAPPVQATSLAQCQRNQFTPARVRRRMAA